MKLIVHDIPGQSRSYELAPAPPDRPVLVGASPDCDICIPRAAVSPRQCGLYTRGGQWFAQDLASSAGTYLNGSRLDQPAILAAGDVISFGGADGVPSLEVDLLPAAAGTGDGNDSDFAALAAAAADPAVVYPATPLHDPADTSFYVPKQRMSGDHMIVAVVVTAGLLIVGAILIYFAVGISRTPKVVIQPAPTTPVGAATQPSSPASGASAPRPSRPAQPTTEQIREAQQRTAAWQRVDEAHRIATPPQAILVFEDYRHAHPDTPLADLLDAYTDEALDRIWWQRIVEVMDRRDRTAETLAELQPRLESETSPPPRLVAEAEDLRAVISRYQQILDEMGYTRAEPPDPYDDAALTQLRAERDPQRYANWREQVLTSIRDTRGLLPW